MRVAAEARLEAQRAACAGPRRRHLGLRQQAPRELLGLLGRHRDLVAVLAGVAGAADQAVDAVDGERLAVHEAERLCTGRQPRQHGGGLGTLQRDERPVRSEEHTSELQSLMRISYAGFCLKKKKIPRQFLSCTSTQQNTTTYHYTIR